jgi:hypothetical protein
MALVVLAAETGSCDGYHERHKSLGEADNEQASNGMGLRRQI